MGKRLPPRDEHGRFRARKPLPLRDEHGRFRKRPPLPPRDPKGRFEKRTPPLSPPRREPPSPVPPSRSPQINPPPRVREKFTKREELQLIFEFDLAPIPLDAIPDRARFLAETWLSEYMNESAVIHGRFIRIVSEDGEQIDDGWRTLAATAKLIASLNNLEFETEALEASQHYREALICDTLSFIITIRDVH